MKNTLCALLAVLCCQFLFAQQDGASQNWGIQKMGIEARADYQREYVSGEAVKENSGFKGQYLNFSLDGKFNEKLSYAYRSVFIKCKKMKPFSMQQTGCILNIMLMSVWPSLPASRSWQ